MDTVGENTDYAGELSALELLSAALQDAMDAHGKRVIVGPAVDEVSLRRAARRARRADGARLLRSIPAGGAA